MTIHVLDVYVCTWAYVYVCITMHIHWIYGWQCVNTCLLRTIHFINVNGHHDSRWRADIQERGFSEIHIWASVTRWIDYFSCFFSFIAMKSSPMACTNYQISLKFCQLLNIHSKYCPRLWVIYHGNEISPNLVMLNWGIIDFKHSPENTHLPCKGKYHCKGLPPLRLVWIWLKK